MIGTDNTPKIKELNIEDCPKGAISRFWLRLAADGIGTAIHIPVMVARGMQDGLTLGITAAVHGNELNGIPVIQRLFSEIEPTQLKGTVVGVPVVNVPGYLLMQRKFNDGIDLNRIMPGKANGNNSEVYAHRFVQRVLTHFDYLLDLHTASFGRINSYYIRANMEDKTTAELAHLQHAQIILNSPAPDQTVRGTATRMGKKAITLEVGDPNVFQKGIIRSGLTGMHNTLAYLGMVEEEIEQPETPPIVCSHSYWIYTDKGGVLQVLPKVTQPIQKGECIAILRNIFGDKLREYYAPEDGIVIGKSVHPVAQTGSRILHLGVLE